MKKLPPPPCSRNNATVTPNGFQVLDISDELRREYRYDDGNCYRIAEPLSLYLKPGATGHRVLDSEGTVHWVPVNVWHCIAWKPRNPSRPVAF